MIYSEVYLWLNIVTVSNKRIKNKNRILKINFIIFIISDLISNA